MSRRRRKGEVYIITTPVETTNALSLKSVNEFKQTVAEQARYFPEKNAVYRRFEEKMSSAKAR
jgi:hypothetical protein